MQLFEILFTYIIFKQFFNILATQNQNNTQNRLFLTKDMNFLSFHSFILNFENYQNLGKNIKLTCARRILKINVAYILTSNLG